MLLEKTKDKGEQIMGMYVLYAACFFAITLLIQFLLRKVNCKRNNANVNIWTGYQVVICLCILGLVTGRLHFLASVIGFVVADEIGKKSGWH